MNNLSIIPSTNLVSNIGIGPDASNTIRSKKIDAYPKISCSIEFPLKHPVVEINKDFDYKYYLKSKPSSIRRIKSFVKKLILK